MTLRAAGDEVRVSVLDSGPGIAPERRANLFITPPALGSHRADSGGLGLLIVHRILQLHHRQIRLLDSDDGAVFAFGLPTARPR